jgi:uncharacterized repeat protein (TIGR01451 family)
MKKLLLFLFIVWSSLGYSQVLDFINPCGNTEFNLTHNTLGLIGNANPANTLVTFHTSITDAQSGQNPIINPEAYNSGLYETIFARVENTITASFTITSFTLTVYPMMQLTIYQTLDVPTSGLSAEVFDGGIAPLSYVWELNGVVLPQQTQSVSILGNPAGIYTVTVTDAAGCVVSASITITSVCTLPAPVTEVVQPSCSNPGSITITNVPDGSILLYAIDGGAPQTATGTGVITIPVTIDNGSHYYTFNFSGDCISESTSVAIYGLAGPQISASGTYFDFNANGYVDVGDVINYVYTVTNSGCSPINDITVDSSISAVTGGPLGALAAGASDNTTFTGTHAITQIEINTGHVYELVILQVNGSAVFQWSTDVTFDVSDGIGFLAFIDTNGNGIKDLAEVEYTGGEFTYQLNNDAIVHHIGANQSFYLYESNPATLYDLNFSVYASNASHYFTTASYNDISVAANSGITTYNFPITVIPFTDLSVSLYNYSTPPRPGFLHSNYLLYRNNGTQVIPSGTVTFTKADPLTIVDVSQSGTTITPTGFTYDFTNLLPGESRLIHVSLQVPTIPTVALGNTLTNVASVSIPSGDINTANNTSSLSQIIVGSYDPNDKTESHGGKIVHAGFGADDYLTYTIRFENTGTASAINVAVADILDNQLEETSVRTVASSHAYTFERVGKNLSWKFNGILLPPSVANTTIGHGYVVFQVKPKPGFVIGDVIPNSADIYFDFNPAIVTEPCVTEFVNALSTEDFAFSHFQFSPNPVTNTLFVSNDTTIENLTISSVLGQNVYEKPIQAMQSEVDLSVLSPGIYLVKATTKTSAKTFKIVKE